MDFSSSFSLKNYKKILLDRFPLPTLAIILIYIFFVMMIESVDSPRYLGDFVSVFVIGFFLSIGTARLSEEHKITMYKKIGLNWIVPVGITSLIYFYIRQYDVDSMEYITYLFLFGGIFLSFVYIGDILGLKKNPTDNPTYARYFTEVSWDFVMSAIIGVTLFALSAILLFSLDELFDITFDNSFAHIANMAFVLASGFYFLMHFPESYTIREKKEARFFHFLIRYVITPFVIIYFVVLYAYSLKVIVGADEWPRGIICWLVIGFSTLGYLQYILAEPLDQEKLIGTTRKYFPYFVLPQTGMLFYAISLRIGQYGITVNRYLVVVFGIWLVIISLYLILSKKKYLQIIVSILSIMLIMISIGPWGAVSVSYQDQWDRLNANLETAKILQNGVIVPLSSKDSIPQKLSVEIYSQIQYLCDFKNCEDIKTLFREQLKGKVFGNMHSMIESEWTSKWEITSYLAETLKLYTYATEDQDILKDPTISLYASEKYNSDVILVGGYEILIWSIGTRQIEEKMETKNTTRSSYEARYLGDMRHIEVYQSGTLLDTIDIGPYTKSLQDWYKKEKTTKKWESIYEGETTKLRYKLLLDSYTITNPLYTGKEKDSNSWLSGKILLKLK